MKPCLAFDPGRSTRWRQGPGGAGVRRRDAGPTRRTLSGPVAARPPNGLGRNFRGLPEGRRVFRRFRLVGPLVSGRCASGPLRARGVPVSQPFELEAGQGLFGPDHQRYRCLRLGGSGRRDRAVTELTGPGENRPRGRGAGAVREGRGSGAGALGR